MCQIWCDMFRVIGPQTLQSGVLQECNKERSAPSTSSIPAYTDSIHLQLFIILLLSLHTLPTHSYCKSLLFLVFFIIIKRLLLYCDGYANFFFCCCFFVLWFFFFFLPHCKFCFVIHSTHQSCILIVGNRKIRFRSSHFML